MIDVSVQFNLSMYYLCYTEIDQIYWSLGHSICQISKSNWPIENWLLNVDYKKSQSDMKYQNSQSIITDRTDLI